MSPLFVVVILTRKHSMHKILHTTYNMFSQYSICNWFFVFFKSYDPGSMWKATVLSVPSLLCVSSLCVLNVFC